MARIFAGRARPGASEPQPRAGVPAPVDPDLEPPLAPEAALPGDATVVVPMQVAPVSGAPSPEPIQAVLDAEAAVAATAPDASAALETGDAARKGPSVGLVAYRVVRELLRGLATAFLSAYLGLLVWSMLPLAIGWTPSVIISGSMLPMIDVGDVVYYAPEPPNSIVAGRVILFEAPVGSGRLVSHRLHERKDDGTYVTKGDANPTPDSDVVRPAQVRGAARLIIPHVGKVALWSPEHRKEAAMWLSVTIAALILARGPKTSPEPPPTRPPTPSSPGQDPIDSPRRGRRR